MTAEREPGGRLGFRTFGARDSLRSTAFRTVGAKRALSAPPMVTYSKPSRQATHAVTLCGDWHDVAGVDVTNARLALSVAT